MIKEKSNEFEKRILRTIACPQNKYIPRVPDAGKIFDDYQLMHNGLKVQIDGYYGEYKSNNRGFITDMLLRNKGVHEPQEERVFQEVFHADNEARDQLRDLHEMHPVLDAVPGYLLRRNARGAVRHRFERLLRLRRLRGRLPGRSPQPSQGAVQG